MIHIPHTVKYCKNIPVKIFTILKTYLDRKVILIVGVGKSSVGVGFLCMLQDSEYEYKRVGARGVAWVALAVGSAKL